MESNFEKESNQGLANGDAQTVSPSEASQALSAIAADQAAIRTAAAPPTWYILLVSVYLGAIFALFAIPDSWAWLITCAKILILAGLLTALVFWFASRRSVNPGRLALFHPVRHAIPIVAVFIVVVVLTCVEPLPIPWWSHLCIGICMGTLTYVVAYRSWRTWAEAPTRL